MASTEHLYDGCRTGLRVGPSETVTPPAETVGMERQLTLIDPQRTWRLDERTRQIGRRGVAEARAALAAHRTDETSRRRTDDHSHAA